MNDDDPLHANAQRKANHCGLMWYVLARRGTDMDQRELVRCDEFERWKSYNGAYWKIEFIAFPERAEVD